MDGQVRQRSQWADLLPQGIELAETTWMRRHRVVVLVILAHAVGLPLFGIFMDWSPALALGEGAIIGLLGGLATLPALSRRFRSSVAALGCITSSAVLVQFSGGIIEAHFHFFIMVALIALYQDWIPFLLAVAFVAADHGIVGTFAPDLVYNHPGAVARPWLWAGIHAVMVLGQCAALLVFWRGAERERARNDLILESAGDAIVGVDNEGRIEFVNPAAKALFGARSMTLLGAQLAHRLLDSAGRPVDLAGDGPSPPREGVLAANDGSRVPIEWRSRPAIGSDDAVTLVVTIQDVSERRQAERERLERLEAQDQFKTQLLNTASHELNTPIAVLRLQLDVLKATMDNAPPDVQQSLDVLDRNVGRLGSLVQETLDVARLQNGQMQLTRERIDLVEVVRETFASFEQLAAQRRVRLDLSAPDPLLVEADPNRLTQVLYNLMSNALKFTPSDGSVTISVHEATGKAIVEVRDTGRGFSQGAAARLFQPFMRLQEADEGTGLGLYISKGIVEAHAGRMWASSAGPGRGALFGFELPLAAQVVVTQALTTPTP